MPGNRNLIIPDTIWTEALREASALDNAQADFLAEAERLLASPPPSVVEKSRRPPSGDPHDYVSQGGYWWPDPSSADGLPYIRRDGEVNPESLDSDNPRLGRMVNSVQHLVFATRWSNDARFAEGAANYLRTWFLNPATRMNPHLEFGQRIPGKCEGRGIGIIDTAKLCWLLDAVVKLPSTPAWGTDENAALQEWFAAYLEWLLTSSHGQNECKQYNNHGTWYDAQVAIFGLYCGKPNVVRHQIESRTMGRIAAHFEPDGSQPNELKRTLSQHYACYNLTAFAIVAQAALPVGLDLWSHETPDGRSIPRGAKWLVPFLLQNEPWPWEQLKPLDRHRAAPLFRLAAHATDDQDLLAAAAQLAESPWQKLYGF